MSNASPGRNGHPPDRSPTTPSRNHGNDYRNSSSPPSYSSHSISPPQQAQANSFSTPIPIAHPYNAPLSSRRAQDFTPTRPSPLSQMYFPPTDPDYDLTPNTNVNVSPSMNINPALLDWPDDNPSWPNSDELDEIFGPASPTKSRIEGAVDVGEARSSTKKHDFTLIPPPLNLTPTRRSDGASMFGDLLPAPLSPSHRTSVAQRTEHITQDPTRPLPKLPLQHAFTDQLKAGQDRTSSSSMNSSNTGVLRQMLNQASAQRSSVQQPTTNDNNSQHLAYNTQTMTATTKSAFPPSAHLTAPKGKTTMTCNLCQLPFRTSRHTIRPDKEGRAYCAECIKTVGDRIVAEQKIVRGIGRAGKLAAARERTRVGGNEVNSDDDDVNADSDEAMGTDDDDDAEEQTMADVDEIEDESFWAEFMQTDFSVSSQLPTIDSVLSTAGTPPHSSHGQTKGSK